MENSFIVEVQSLEEAQSLGSKKWSVEPEDVVVEVLEENKGIWGLFSKKRKVQVALSGELHLLKAKKFLKELFSYMELDVVPEVIDDDSLNLTGKDAGIIIGRYGETLKALEYMANLVLRDSMKRVNIDSDGYKERRLKSLEKLALAAAREATRKGRPVKLEPMSSWERRIIHLTLKDREDVTTNSQGVEPQRCVVVTPLKSRARKATFRATKLRGKREDN
ncbi:single-stranded nucleic acid binding R3H domain-containing protein [Thermovirga lienii DSM 17291]|jgi:spoIIIJ-associated protein|uniref:Single-stranded nucleic acid binding R3H domain-containing protein n=1 Tax=Thermovirga lienii (strain ATCC BAA-1197 / DSM 17291 / Cas60314) TaxID=580340 RepID=G7V979_THELD|nr:RNA-binding cell elongation regulator Jag/EloR [Thermovirga lienii]AER66448.1 single-stranded nucleic acid binding R3H domain-containing protein [Thermovirga lienii DSM 17291]HCD72410.1 KH domain-containing protein [Thermovirga lienii]